MQFPCESAEEENRTEYQTTKLFTVSKRISPFKERPAVSIVEEKLVLALLESVEAVLMAHGLDVLPVGLLPITTQSSLSAELAKLRSLRNEYVERLERMNKELDERESNENLSEEAGEFPAPSTSSEVSRLEEHKRNKERIRLEMKEMLHILAGLLADHQNLTIPEVINEYRNRP